MRPPPSPIGTKTQPLKLEWLRVHVHRLALQLAQLQRVQSRLEYRHAQVGHRIKDATVSQALAGQYARHIARQRAVVESLHEQCQIARAQLSILEEEPL